MRFVMRWQASHGRQRHEGHDGLTSNLPGAHASRPGHQATSHQLPAPVQSCYLRALKPLGGQVTAFSRWERELPKLVGEPRFQGVPTMKERRSLFDGYCKAAPDISKRRTESKRAALEAFQGLLAEATSLPGVSAAAG